MKNVYVVLLIADVDGEFQIQIEGVCATMEWAQELKQKLIKRELTESWPTDKDHTVVQDSEIVWHVIADEDEYDTMIKIEETTLIGG